MMSFYLFFLQSPYINKILSRVYYPLVCCRIKFSEPNEKCIGEFFSQNKTPFVNENFIQTFQIFFEIFEQSWIWLRIVFRRATMIWVPIRVDDYEFLRTRTRKFTRLLVFTWWNIEIDRHVTNLYYILTNSNWNFVLYTLRVLHVHGVLRWSDKYNNFCPIEHLTFFFHFNFVTSALKL